MTIELPNAAEAGMPEVQIGHCKQLLAWRIENQFTELPAAGADVEILYSTKDPLMESDEVDYNAYFIYFTIGEVQGTTFEDAVITCPLAY